MLEITTSAEGLKLLSQGDVNGARGIFNNLLANKQDLAQANYGLGVIALGDRNPALAREHFESCLWHKPNHANALFQLGSIEKRTGNNDAAVQYWRRCLNADPDHVGALKELASIQPPVMQAPPQPSRPPAPEPIVQPPVALPPVSSVEGYDLYGLLKRCDSGVEREMVRLLDEVQDMMASKRQGISAFIGGFITSWVIAAVIAIGLFAQPSDELKLVAVGLIGLVLLVTLGRMVEIKCNKIDCDRYVFVQQKGVLATRSRNDHLWLMSHEEVFVHRSLMNRLTNDGTLLLGENTFKGFFNRDQLRTIQKNFAQLRLLMPTNREVLAAIGELKNMRTGDK